MGSRRLRIGYLVAHGEIVSAIERAGLPYATTSVAQLAALASLDADFELALRVEEMLAERRRVVKHVRRLGVDLVEPEANFAWLPVGTRARQLTHGLAARGVLVRCYVRDGVRVTIGSPADNTRFLSVLESVWPRCQASDSAEMAACARRTQSAPSSPKASTNARE